MLLKIAVDVPSILYQIDTIKAGRYEDSFDSFDKLRQHTISILQELHLWSRDVVLNPASRAGGQLCHPINSAALALHDAILLVMSEPCSLLCLPLLPKQQNTAQALRTQKYNLATRIYRLATSSIGEKTSVGGAFFFIFPLYTAAKHLALEGFDDQHIFKYMSSVIGDAHGFDIGKKARELE